LAREPNYREKEDFLVCIRTRDEKGLRQLIMERLPDVIWGGVYKQLSDEDRQWAEEVIRRL